MSNDFAQRLYNHEVAPPAQAWDKINSALDELDPMAVKIGSKIYEAAIEPPAGAWNKIAEAITDSDTKVVPLPFIKRIKPYYRYAAAAILIVALVFGGNLLLNTAHTIPEDQASTTVVTNPGIPPAKAIEENVTSSQKEEPPVEATNDFDNDRPVIAVASTSGARQAAYYDSDNSPAKLESNFSLAELENRFEPLIVPGLALSYNGSSNGLNRYVTLIRPDGYVIRMSAKFADMIGCMYSSGVVNNDEDCKQQLKQWRTKMARASVTPSPDNFMDILSLVNSLQEN